MREHHPYDKSLGEKMKGLPVPDEQKSWEKMRLLLDKEMPPGRSKRRGGWWFPGALLIMMITATGILVTVNLSPPHGDPPLSARGPGDGPPSASNQNLSEKPTEPNGEILLKQQQINSASNQTGGQTLASDGAGDPLESRELSDSQVFSDNPDLTYARVLGEKRTVLYSGVSSQIRLARNDRIAVTDRDPGENGSSNSGNVSRGVESNFLTDADAPGESQLQYTVVAGPAQFAAAGLSASFDSFDLDKPLAAQYAVVSRKFYRKLRRSQRPPNVREPYTTAGRTFAFGVSLPLAFPLGDQKMLGYNISAGPNTVSDYIPAPHVQYHFNSKSYVQTEVQVMSPQYIRPVMLHHNEYQTSVAHVSSSVYARKLYYFNVPVSVHYSPFKHFYLGTGLQFSTLLGGVAEHEKIRTGMVSSDSLYQSSYARFGNDSVGNRLRGNEMRLMLDANYYWNRFTVGLRYNQAFHNYVSLRASSTAAYTLDKNKALQFYMRFNLWEGKKRRHLQTRLLTYR